MPSKTESPLLKGDRLIIETSGGGGFGDPRERERDAVLRDVEDGVISEDEARRVYGLGTEWRR